MCLFLPFRFSCVIFAVCVFPFVTSPVLFPPHSPHLLLIPSLVSLCLWPLSPSCVCQFVPSSVSILVFPPVPLPVSPPLVGLNFDFLFFV